MEYVDLYLIHWPVCIKPGPPKFPNKKEDAVPVDFEGVWRAMEECQRLGLARAIGVSNFTTKHLDRVLAVATIPPAVNQVELNPVWQQRTLRAYCADRGIHVAAYSPLGGQNWDGQGNAVLDSEVLAEIAKARGKTVAQVRTLAANSTRAGRPPAEFSSFSIHPPPAARCVTIEIETSDRDCLTSAIYLPLSPHYIQWCLVFTYLLGGVAMDT